MSQLIPYTLEELDEMSIELYIELVEIKSPRLYPYCLIGLPLSEARKKMSEYFGEGARVEILIAGKQICLMDIRVVSWFCTIDENNIMTDVWSANQRK